MNNIRCSSFHRCRCLLRWWTRRGSTITGIFVPSSLDLWMTYLLNGFDPPDVFVSVHGCQDDCIVEGNPGGTDCGLRVSMAKSLEPTGFEAQNGPHLLKWAKVSSSGKSRLFHDQEQGSVQRCPGSQSERSASLLEAIVIKKPEKASNGGSTWPL